jgi:hypothetical protein
MGSRRAVEWFSLGARFSFLNVYCIRRAGEQLHRDGLGYDRPNPFASRAAIEKPLVPQDDNS